MHPRSLPVDKPVSRPDGEPTGSFVISLDCELFWGVRDKRRLQDYRENLLGDRQVVPRLLDLFDEFGIHATWAFVGFLFYSDRSSLVSNLPDRVPKYTNARFSPYAELAELGEDETLDPFHFGGSLIDEVLRHPGQEIASHTFSHFYCLEQGQTLEDFQADLEATCRAARRHGIELRSLVFPRNQVNPDYLEACYDLGICAYRGNTSSWLYRAMTEEEESVPRRALRYADAFVNISGKRIVRAETNGARVPVDVPASRFLYPQYPWSARLDGMRIRRIANEMRAAAQNGCCYHLWWHPHNFGVNQEANLRILRRILEQYLALHDEYGFEALSMCEVADRALRRPAA
jgi:peptidoglycan/xylan/chitin deacetylase (PgdA/CDA1 family)